MFNVTVLCVGQMKESYLQQCAAEYSKRLGAFCRLQVTETETDRLLPLLSQFPRAYKVALCVEGKQLSSEELAGCLETLPGRGYGGAVFVIGGFDGLPEEVKAACDLRLSFSKMTFPHRLMRIILLEQIYRAFTIINHGKYHH